VIDLDDVVLEERPALARGVEVNGPATESIEAGELGRATA